MDEDKLNYFSKKYVLLMSSKPLKKKLSVSRFQCSKLTTQKTISNKIKQVSYDISQNLEDKTSLNKKDQINDDILVVNFFYDESRPSFIQNTQSIIKQVQLINNEAIAKEQICVLQKLKQILVQKQDNPQQQLSQIISSIKSKEVLSEPDIECPESPSLRPMLRRKTQSVMGISIGKNLSKSMNINRLLKRFNNYQSQKSLVTKQSLVKITQKHNEQQQF